MFLKFILSPVDLSMGLFLCEVHYWSLWAAAFDCHWQIICSLCVWTVIDPWPPKKQKKKGCDHLSLPHENVTFLNYRWRNLNQQIPFITSTDECVIAAFLQQAEGLAGCFLFARVSCIVIMAVYLSGCCAVT